MCRAKQIRNLSDVSKISQAQVIEAVWLKSDRRGKPLHGGYLFDGVDE